MVAGWCAGMAARARESIRANGTPSPKEARCVDPWDSVRMVLSAGEALPPKLLADWLERTGVEILDGQRARQHLADQAGQLAASLGQAAGEALHDGLLVILDRGQRQPHGDLLAGTRLRRVAAPWRPWRTVACWYLWKSLEMVPT